MFLYAKSENPDHTSRSMHKQASDLKNLLSLSRPWSYYLTFMSRLSNVWEILQFHYRNVTLYTKKETVPQGQILGICFLFLFYI